MLYPFYIDPYYLVLVIPALLLGFWAQARVSSAYNKYSQVRASRGVTGAQAARMILDGNGLGHVGVEEVPGNLSDHYDPKTNMVRLSSGVYNSASIAAVGIAAHECGHAVQRAESYTPMKIRGAIIPITNIGSSLAIPLILVGFLLNSYWLIVIGIAGYGLIALFQLVTLPVEYNASARAMAIISEHHILEEDEQTGARKVLNAAALTYVAALAASIAQLLRLVLMFGNRNSRR